MPSLGSASLNTKFEKSMWYIYIYINDILLNSISLWIVTFRILLGMLQGEFVVCNHVSEIGLRQSFWLVWLPKTNILLHVLDPDRRNQRSYLEIYFSKYFIKLKVIFELIIRNYNLYQLCWLESQNTIALYKDFGTKHFFLCVVGIRRCKTV